jgi:two-component system sensor histidine kinase YesM
MVFTYIFVISRFITRFTEERLNTDYKNILSESCDTVGNILWNITLTSQQLLDNAEIQANLENYYTAPDRYSRKDNNSRLLNSVFYMTMFNSDIGLVFFYDIGTRDFIYSSLPSTVYTDNEKLLYQTSSFQFRGPCKSQSNFVGNPVLILSRKETLPGGNTVLLSIESGYYSLDRALHSVEQKSAFLIFTNSKKNIIFSTLPERFDASAILQELHSGLRHDYRFFDKQTPQGWTAHILIPDSVYTHDYQFSLRDFILCTMLLAVLVSFITIYFWKSIYKPLQFFDRQLSGVLSDKIPVADLHSSIPEYEYLLNRIALLQEQIQDMIRRTINQEKMYSHMQLEKLRAQINPHFLLNTLNTLHWMALMNQQTDIDKITQSLSHLLAYNLDKQSYKTNLNKELIAVTEYVTLQKVRYSFDFSIDSQIEPENLNYPCPKFILQPLIENSLSHGYREQMEIRLTIRVAEQIEIEIRDTGTGIDKETLEKLQNLAPVENYPAADKNNKIPAYTHFGIGVPYVVQSLNDFYNGNCKFSISSIPGKGTIISLKLPKLKGNGYHVENSDY